MADMRYVVTSVPIDLSEWELGFGDFHDIIAKSLSEAVTNTLDETPPMIELPFTWSSTDSDGRRGKAVSDPLTLYLVMPLNAGPDHGCIWEISLNEVFEDSWEIIDRGEAAKLSAALRDLANRLDKIESE